ncbi:UNVERIFIED_CONTAM: hypothetical protein HDU68_004650, partial [Siphonaria sp. JEL0065]
MSSTMEYRYLGRSGLKVSVLSLGAMTFGGQVDEETGEQILKEAFDNGINFIDNAERYTGGKAEIAVGKAIKKFGWKRSTYVI